MSPLAESAAHLKLLRPEPGDSLSDLELVAAVRRGDSRVALEFYGKVAPRIWTVLRRLLRGNEQDHEDLAQQTLVALVTGLGRYKGQAPLEMWAGAVAGHIALDWLRHHRRERALFERLGEASLERPSRDQPEHAVLTREVVDRLKVLLAGVAEDRLDAWVLHDVYGFSLAELALMTDASLSAVQSRLVRGRGDVQARLARDPSLAQTLQDLGERR